MENVWVIKFTVFERNNLFSYTYNQNGDIDSCIGGKTELITKDNNYGNYYHPKVIFQKNY